MILVDKNIKSRSSEIFLSGYNENNVNSISYDLTVKCIYGKDEKAESSYELNPGEVVFVQSLECIKIPYNFTGIIAEKNSRMRQGLVVSGPTYQPGHSTYCFLRVQNISENIIELNEGMKIAQIIFELLIDYPDVAYDSQKNASFNNETSYRGLGNYKEEYNKKTREYIDKKEKSIEELSHTIYANVLTIMGIIVAIFSLLTINFQAFTSTNLTISYIIIMNLTIMLSVVVMFGVVLIFINHAKNKCFLAAYIGIIIVLIVLLVLFSTGKIIPTSNVIKTS